MKDRDFIKWLLIRTEDSRPVVLMIGSQYTSILYSLYGGWILIKDGRLYYLNSGQKEMEDIVE